MALLAPLIAARSAYTAAVVVRRGFGGQGVRGLTALVPLLVLAGCAAAPRPAPQWIPCDRVPGYESYVDRLGSLIARELDEEFDKLDAQQRVTLKLWLLEDGSLEKLDVRSSTSPAVRELGLRAVRAAEPFPAPPHPLRQCVVGTATEIMLFSLGPPCDRKAADVYLKQMIERIAASLRQGPLRDRPGSGRVTLELRVDDAGTLLDVKASKAASEAASELALAAVRAAAPFDPPDPSFRECLLDPLRFWLDVPEARWY